MNHATPEAVSRVGVYTQLLSSTRRGARLARLLSGIELRSWGVPPDLTERAELVVAELAANAVLHGHLPGRCFRLRLMFDASAARLHVEVTDARGDRHPRTPAYTEPQSLDSGGRGLTLVAALADHWDCVPCPPSGKTVRAVLSEPTITA